MEKALRSLTRGGIEVPLSGGRYRVNIRWAEDERVDVVLEKGVLIIYMPYVEELERALAKALFLASPYLISPHLVAVFGEELARALAVNVAYRHASRDDRVFRHLEELVNERRLGDSEFEEVMTLVQRADQASYYSHIFLTEVGETLREYVVAELKRDVFRRGALELLRLLANLSEVEEPYLCGSYLRLVVVRAGRLEKVTLGMWESYARFVEQVRARCRGLRKIYVVSAGDVIRKKVASELVRFMEEKIGAKLVREEFYTALMYKGRPRVPAYVAALLLTSSGG